jgi:hypothetical protein
VHTAHCTSVRVKCSHVSVSTHHQHTRSCKKSQQRSERAENLVAVRKSQRRCVCIDNCYNVFPLCCAIERVFFGFSLSTPNAGIFRVAPPCHHGVCDSICGICYAAWFGLTCNLFRANVCGVFFFYFCTIAKKSFFIFFLGLMNFLD